MCEPGVILRRPDVFSRILTLAALCLGTAASGSALAASKTVYRCTAANGQVTLSDRRCPDDDAPAKASRGDANKSDVQKAAAAKPAASQASAALSKVCGEAKDKLTDRRKQKNLTAAERSALRQLEDEHRRTCGA